MPISATSQQEFSDADFRVVGNGDQSKKVALDVSGIATGTTRTWTVPDADVTVTAAAATVLDDTTVAAMLATLGAVAKAGDTMTGGLTVPMVISAQTSIADDAVYARTIPFAASAGLVIISGGGIPGMTGTPTGIWWIRKTATDPVAIITPNTNITLGTADLTGTTTADGGYGLSVVSSTTLKLENRSGSTQTMNFTFIGA